MWFSNRVRSSIECSVLCKGTEGCTGVNWKKPSTCELYLTSRRSFGTDTSCVYFELEGKTNLIAQARQITNDKPYYKIMQFIV